MAISFSMLDIIFSWFATDINKNGSKFSITLIVFNILSLDWLNLFGDSISFMERFNLFNNFLKRLEPRTPKMKLYVQFVAKLDESFCYLSS